MTRPAGPLRPDRSMAIAVGACIDKVTAPLHNRWMVCSARNILAVTALFWALPAFTANAALDRTQFESVLVTARDYADDRSLVFYCLRASGEQIPFIYAGLQTDIEQTLQRMKTAGASARQSAEMVQMVMSNMRFYQRDAKDAALDRRCIARDVERTLAEGKGVSVPLFLRPPFDKMAK